MARKENKKKKKIPVKLFDKLPVKYLTKHYNLFIYLFIYFKSKFY